MNYVRMYETEQKARDAITKLRKGGFPEDTIHLVTAGANGEALLGYMIGNEPEVYAENLARGRIFVLVRAAFGHGQAAIDILDSCEPIDSHLLAQAEPANCWEEAVTPLSTALQWPVLKQNDPAPFSKWMGFPLLSKSGEPGPFSKWLGSRLLFEHDRPAPFSSWMGFPTLDPGYTMSRYFGFDLLISNATPLSSRLGLNTLVGWTALPGEASDNLPPPAPYQPAAPALEEPPQAPAEVPLAAAVEEPPVQATDPAESASPDEVIQASPAPEPPADDRPVEGPVTLKPRGRQKTV
jgi:hypothetical protein